MSVLFCDSNCELWYDKVDRLGLKVIAMPYTIEGTEYFYDMGRSTDFHAFFDKVRKGSMPVTSALNPQDYLDYFDPVLKSGEDIFYITFSHELSGTFNSLRLAMDELLAKYPGRKITVIDSKNISGGNALIVAAAAKLKQSGASDAQLADAVNKMIPKAHSYFTVDDLHHLKRGGRISGVAAVVGSMLGVKPMLRLNESGKIENYAKAKGRKKSMSMLIEKAKELDIDLSRPCIVLDADSSDGIEFFEAVRHALGGEAEIWYQPVGPVIGTHCGPGTLGLCFFSK